MNEECKVMVEALKSSAEAITIASESVKVSRDREAITAEKLHNIVILTLKTSLTAIAIIVIGFVVVVLGRDYIQYHNSYDMPSKEMIQNQTTITGSDNKAERKDTNEQTTESSKATKEAKDGG